MYGVGVDHRDTLNLAEVENVSADDEWRPIAVTR